MEALLLHDKALDEIFHVGVDRKPAEAVGILLPEPYRGTWIKELPNRSSRPHDGFMFTRDDLALALEDWFEEASAENVARLTLWHTHPSGGIGPSRIDMRNRLQHMRHLVVTITDEGPVPTWY